MKRLIVFLPSGIRRRKARRGFVKTVMEMLKTVRLLHQIYRICFASVKYILLHIDHF